MKKRLPIIISVLVVFVLIVVLFFLMSLKTTSNLGTVNSSEDLTTLINNIYESLTIELPMLQTQDIDITDDAVVQLMTGLESGSDLEYIVASEPMMSSQAYSLVLAKVKDGVNANEIAKKMNENIDARKWICVTAEKVYTTSSGNIVCLIMSNEDTAKPIYEKFKELAGTVGEEFERTEQEAELPEDMY